MKQLQESISPGDMTRTPWIKIHRHSVRCRNEIMKFVFLNVIFHVQKHQWSFTSTNKTLLVVVAERKDTPEHCLVCQTLHKVPLTLQQRDINKGRWCSRYMHGLAAGFRGWLWEGNPPLVRVSRTPDFSKYLLNCSRLDSAACGTDTDTHSADNKLCHSLL